MKYRAFVAVLVLVLSVGLTLFAFPQPGHPVAVTGIALMIIGAIVAGIGLTLGSDGGVTSRRR